MRKKSEEYVPQFILDDEEISYIKPLLCKGCEKLSEYINEEGLCFECEQRLKKQQINNVATDYYSQLIQQHDLQQIENLTNKNKSIKKFYGGYFKFKMCLKLFPSALTLLFLMIGIISGSGIFLCASIPAAMCATIGLCDVCPIIRNINALKNMGLYNLTGAKKPTEEKVLFDEDGIVITEKFIYCITKRIILPISHIQTIEKMRGYRSTTRNTAFYHAILSSGKRFVFLELLYNHHSSKMFEERLFREIKSINSTIEINDMSL